jgi:hypothetical protein
LFSLSELFIHGYQRSKNNLLFMNPAVIRGLFLSNIADRNVERSSPPLKLSQESVKIELNSFLAGRETPRKGSLPVFLLLDDFKCGRSLV